jgi:predicted nucleotidyltransferase
MNVQNTVSNIVDSLKQVSGISALVLGGSRARGTESPNSDIDIGLPEELETSADLTNEER